MIRLDHTFENKVDRKPRVWAEIDLEAIVSNLQVLKSKVATQTQLMPVIKADAYGHGACRVASRLAKENVWAFGVGDSREALELRGAGIRGRVLILGTIVEGEMRDVLANDISVCLHSTDRIRRLELEGEKQERRVGVHLMIDTGMGRLGVRPEKALSVLHEIGQSPHLRLDGIATHFAGTGDDDPTKDVAQLDVFNDVRNALDKMSKRPIAAHAANSRAILLGIGHDLSVVRPGIALYGVDPRATEVEAKGELRPVLSLRTQVCFLKDVEPGGTVGYGRTHQCPRRTRIATLPIGYADGWPHSLSNCGDVLVRSQRARILGSVTMDYTMIDVGHIQDVAVGDTVTLIGRDGRDRICVDEVASKAKMIPYEMMTLLGRRVERLYSDASVPKRRR